MTYLMIYQSDLLLALCHVNILMLITWKKVRSLRVRASLVPPLSSSILLVMTLQECIGGESRTPLLEVVRTRHLVAMVNQIVSQVWPTNSAHQEMNHISINQKALAVMTLGLVSG